MDRIKMGEDLSFSKIVHGHWRLNDWNLTTKELLHLTHACLEKGLTTFDHADIYGDYTCEERFGEVLKLEPSLRSNIEIVTKCGIKLLSNKHPDHYIKHYDTSKDYIIKSVNQSLNNLATDYIDVLLIHRPDPYMDPSEVAEAFIQLKADGKVRAFGVSNFTPSQVAMLDSYLPFSLVTNQIELSVLHTTPFLDGSIDQCLERRMSPMAWSPLAGGRVFTGEDDQSVRVRETITKLKDELNVVSIDQVMLAWLLQHPANIVPIIGTGNLERIERSIEALDIKLTRQQWFDVWESSLGHEVP
ncbi:aldo/keto reductase [Alkalihalobacterium chitinilyticum]|uniref:Aldo/keto reductase family oxidoreductase n=1 Tax=Alkalihalobacterium chitinilyticum TaxID=2980103 RepID=A0ABT5VIG8_9BACI|nr:aldo/keto reductase family oxidoreductase [Alkalihalobacterium chitinilyticum]MDE5415251.1 aldo/keto reductase family oxidoreductase [Alkalihalobacterium chitinilyticum]